MKEASSQTEAKLERVSGLLEHLIAVQMYQGGATQPEIAVSLSMSLGKVNRLVKGVKPPQQKYGKE